MTSLFSICRLGVLLGLLVPGNVWADEKGPERWENDIRLLEERMNSGAVPRNSVLFVGSSSIRLWNLSQSFPDLKTVNHGFGGSQLADTNHFFGRIVVPVRPEIIVVYAGDNDIAAGKTPDEVHNDFKTLVSLVEQNLPECRRLVYISIKPSVKRWAMASEMQKANALIEATCLQNPRLRYLDVWTPMLTSEGMPNEQLLVQDGLHMSDRGYKVWSDALRPHLTESAVSQ